MKTKTKALVLSLCAVLLVVTTVFATMAYLTSNDSVQNTFTVGNVKITLDEAKVNTDGSVVTGQDAARVKANTYKLIPGHSYTKDPTVHVDSGSEDCWIFVKLENGLKDIIAATTIEDQITANGWTLIDSTNNIYAYNNAVSAGDDIDVFGSFKLTTDADVEDYVDEVIKVTAYAIQKDGFNSAQAAWTAAGSEAQN